MSYIGKPVSGLNLNPNAKGAVTVQQFVANGTDYSYGLIKTPLSKNYVDVYVQGVYQNKDEYSVTGSLITFNTLILNGYKVEVVIQDAVTATDTIVQNISPIGFANKIVVTENHTVPAGYNMISGGPITVADGVTVEVSEGSAWTIV